MGTSRLRTPSSARLKSRDPEDVQAAAMATPKKFRRPENVSRGSIDFLLAAIGMVNPSLRELPPPRPLARGRASRSLGQQRTFGSTPNRGLRPTLRIIVAFGGACEAGPFSDGSSKGEASDFSPTVTGSWLGVSPQNYGHRNLIHLNRWQFGSVPIAFGNTGTSLESLQTQLFLLRRRPYFNIDRASPKVFRVFMIVCSCNVLSDCDVRNAVNAADDVLRHVKHVYACLGCSAECGRCARTIKTIINDALGACAQACHAGCPHSLNGSEERLTSPYSRLGGDNPSSAHVGQPGSH
jgi:bacterioferritin-associated ferredoxin